MNQFFILHEAFENYQSFPVIQSQVMSVDLRIHLNSFYTNLITILNYYNITFNFNYENLDDTRIMHFVNHMHKKYITQLNHLSQCNSQKLEFYHVL